MGVMIYKMLKSILVEYLKAPVISGSSGRYATPSEDPCVIISLMEESFKRYGYEGLIGCAIQCVKYNVYYSANKTMGEPVIAE